MAAPKPNPSQPPEDRWGLPPEDEPVIVDERRFEELLRQPGVIVHRGNPELANKTFKPIGVIEGSMTVEDLLRLLGRRDPQDDWLDQSIDSDDPETVETSASRTRHSTEATMAAPKYDPAPFPDDFWSLASDGTPNVLDERRLELLRRAPGVVVHRRNDELARQFKPLKTVGHISLEELRRLLGRAPEDEDGWEWGNEDERDPSEPIGS